MVRHSVRWAQRWGFRSRPVSGKVGVALPLAWTLLLLALQPVAAAPSAQAQHLRLGLVLPDLCLLYTSDAADE